MTVINTNVGALMARTYASKAAQKTETSMERLSSGLRINGAADDAWVKQFDGAQPWSDRRLFG